MDIHKKTASEIFGIPEDQVTPEQRRAAKAINFKYTYGSVDTGRSSTIFGGPPMQNIPVPRTEAGGRLIALVREVFGRTRKT